MGKTKIISGHYYHLYNRGVNREIIFFQRQHWSFFMNRVEKYFVGEHVHVLAYCLMPNHFHILIEARSNKVGMKVMQPFGTSYTKAVNKHMGRVGPIFQGTYKARLVENTADLLDLSRYIHRNPVDAMIARRPTNWRYSSYRNYLGLRKQSFVHLETILEHFDCIDAYRRFVEEIE